MYGARGVVLTKRAERDLREVERLGYERAAGLHREDASSLSDDAEAASAARATSTSPCASIQINAGAGFLVVLTGDILRMPGLPKQPLAERIDLRGDDIVGV